MPLTSPTPPPTLLGVDPTHLANPPPTLLGSTADACLTTMMMMMMMMASLPPVTTVQHVYFKASTSTNGNTSWSTFTKRTYACLCRPSSELYTMLGVRAQSHCDRMRRVAICIINSMTMVWSSRYWAAVSGHLVVLALTCLLWCGVTSSLRYWVVVWTPPKRR